MMIVCENKKGELAQGKEKENVTGKTYGWWCVETNEGALR